jgi:cytochrome c oxidase subunit 2
VAKWWSVLFAVMMAACAALFFVAPFVGWWLPPGVSTHAWDIDFLFYVILAITGFFFVLTEALLVIFMWKYAARTEPRPEAEPGPTFWETVFAPFKKWIPDEHRLEMAWTIVPAVILLYIAFAQIGTWAEAKYKSRMPGPDAKEPGQQKPVHIDVSARQFEWRMRYPNVATWKKIKDSPALFEDWVKKPHFDDLHVVNELHIIKDRPVIVTLTTRDVIHSFNVPHMRVKQDVLPGKVLKTWFTATQSNTKKVVAQKRGQQEMRWLDGGGHEPGTPEYRQLVWEIPCAELCGWGHSRMIGKVFVHADVDDFEAWLQYTQEQQFNPEKAR